MRAFLALLSRRGAATLPLAELTAAIASDALAALRAEGVIRRGAPARTHPCGADEPGCAREVRGFDDDDDLGLDEDGHSAPRDGYVAVCTRTPHACPFVPLTHEDLAQVTIALAPLGRAVARVLRLAPPPRAPHAPPVAHAAEPLLLGEETRDGEARDVYLLVHPRAALGDMLAARERDPRPATFLVPTAHGVDPTLFARHGLGAHVELARLDDLVTVRGGALVAAPRLRVVPPRPAVGRTVARPPAPTFEARPLPPLARWSDLRVCLADGETVLLTIDGVSSRRTHVDLGMAAKNNRKPTRAWRVLVAMLEGEGRFRWRDFGTYEAAAKGVSDLRAALKRELALDDDPFEVLADGQGWRPRFTAKKEPPLDKDAGQR